MSARHLTDGFPMDLLRSDEALTLDWDKGEGHVWSPDGVTVVREGDWVERGPNGRLRVLP